MSWKLRKPRPNGSQPLSAIQCCASCQSRLVPMFKGSSEPDTWEWLECDACNEPVCESCSDVDDEGGCECVDCCIAVHACTKALA